MDEITIVKKVNYFVGRDTGKNMRTEQLKAIIPAIEQDTDIEIATINYREFLSTKDRTLDKAEISKMKSASFGAFVPAAVFKDAITRRETNISYLTGLISLDFDHLPDLDAVKEVINNDEHTLFSFVSPSGDGLKAVVRYKKLEKIGLSEQIVYYKEQLFPALQDYYKEKYQLEIDPACKDTTRCVFVCHDDKTYANNNAVPFDIKPVMGKLKKKVTFVQRNNDVLDKLYQRIIDERMSFEEFTEKCFGKSSGYENWIHFGWFLCSMFHQEDKIKAYFHQFSALDQSYKEKECDDKITRLIKDFRPEAKNYKLYFYIMVKYAKERMGLELTSEEMNVIKQEPNFIQDYIKDNMVIKQEEISEKTYITFTHSPSNIEYVDKELDDVTLNTIYCILKLYFSIGGMSELRSYLFTDNMVRFNKVQNYLDKIRTDDPSYLEKFIDFVPVKESHKVKNMYLRSWMLGVICNFYKHEDKCNKFLIFKGPQLWGKTTLVKYILLSPFVPLELVEENFHFSTESKDDLQKLNTMLFLFDDELSASSKKDIENIKKITSQNSMTYRKPYGFSPKTYYRISSFIGCSNQEQVFNDETGGGRWWVLEINKVIMPADYKGIYTPEFMEKCWGYIYDQYCKGERWNEGSYKIDYALQAQLAEDSRVKTSEEEFLRNILIPDDRKPLTQTEIISEIMLQYPECKMNFLNYSNRFGKLLKTIGIEKIKRNTGGIYKCRVKMKGQQRIDPETFLSRNGVDIFNLPERPKPSEVEKKTFDEAEKWFGNSDFNPFEDL